MLSAEFARYDADGDGFVEAKDIGRMLGVWQEERGRQRLHSGEAASDAQHPNPAAQSVSARQKKRGGLSKDELQDIIAEFDLDGDGKLSVSERAVAVASVHVDRGARGWLDMAGLMD